MSGSILGGGISVTVDAREQANRGARWLARGGSLLGGTIAGLAANVIGGAYPLASTLAIAIAVVFVAVIAIQLRRLPAQAPIHRLVARAGLGGAALAVVASLIAPPSWTGWRVLLAAALGLAGSLTPASSVDTLNQVGGAAAVGGDVRLPVERGADVMAKHVQRYPPLTVGPSFISDAQRLYPANGRAQVCVLSA